MKILRAYRTELRLNNGQQTACLRHAGAARFTYNWGLARRIEEYKRTGKMSNAIEQHKQLNALKRKEFPWMYDVSKCAPQEALRDLDRSFTNLFDGRAEFPRFKSRKRGVGSFRLTGSIRVFGDAIQLPRLGKLRLKEKSYFPTFKAQILSATVSERAGRWFVSLQVEEEHEVAENSGPVVGVDLGVKAMATVSDGKVFENPKPLSRCERKLKRLQRQVSRKEKGSRNRRKAVRRLQRIHARISNIRVDHIHKATTWLAKTKSAICIEGLNVSGMMRNHHLSKAIGDTGMRLFRRQLEYKTGWFGSKLVVANKFYPSSKMCSACGHTKRSLDLSDRVFVCENCHSQVDRDLNAAVNLEKLAVSCTESINACESREVHATRQVLGGEAGTKHHPEQSVSNG